MALIKFSGYVSALTQTMKRTVRDSELINTNSFHFRLGNRPFVSEVGADNLKDGDQITVVADENPQESVVVALRNETTGALYLPPDAKPKLSIVWIIIGIITVPIIVGVAILIATWASYQVDKNKHKFHFEVKQTLG